MIKKFDEFLQLAKEKHGDKFSYIKETYQHYSTEKMTIVHNETKI